MAQSLAPTQQRKWTAEVTPALPMPHTVNIDLATSRHRTAGYIRLGMYTAVVFCGLSLYWEIVSEK